MHIIVRVYNHAEQMVFLAAAKAGYHEHDSGHYGSRDHHCPCGAHNHGDGHKHGDESHQDDNTIYRFAVGGNYGPYVYLWATTMSLLLGSGSFKSLKVHNFRGINNAFTSIGIGIVVAVESPTTWPDGATALPPNHSTYDQRTKIMRSNLNQTCVKTVADDWSSIMQIMQQHESRATDNQSKP